MAPYDIVILSCEGAETTGTKGALDATELANLERVPASNGGRVFASHFHYAWFNKGAFGGDNLATWHTGANAITDQKGTAEINANVVTTLADGGAFPRGEALFTFLGNTGALGSAANLVGPQDGTGPNELNIQSPKHNDANVTAANTPSQAWLVADSDASAPWRDGVSFSFDTPGRGVDGGNTDAGAATYCGRVVFSDLHVGSAVIPADYKGTVNTSTPTGCSASKLSPQEKARSEFMLFGPCPSCVSSDSNLPIPPKCTPLTRLARRGVVCGSYPNGCGTGSIACGTCPGGTRRASGGQCSMCVPATTCPAGMVCGGSTRPTAAAGSFSAGRAPRVTLASTARAPPGARSRRARRRNLSCGRRPATAAVERSSAGAGPAFQGETCEERHLRQSAVHESELQRSWASSGGPAGDGCGGQQDCGDLCRSPDLRWWRHERGWVCGQSDANLCAPLTCVSQHIQCGPAGRWLRRPHRLVRVLHGRADVRRRRDPRRLRVAELHPLSCGTLGLQCGPTGDGCGGIVSCGTCTPPLSCGGGGTPWRLRPGVTRTHAKPLTSHGARAELRVGGRRLR